MRGNYTRLCAGGGFGKFGIAPPTRTPQEPKTRVRKYRAVWGKKAMSVIVMTEASEAGCTDHQTKSRNEKTKWNAAEGFLDEKLSREMKWTQQPTRQI